MRAGTHDILPGRIRSRRCFVWLPALATLALLVLAVLPRPATTSASPHRSTQPLPHLNLQLPQHLHSRFPLRIPAPKHSYTHTPHSILPHTSTTPPHPIHHQALALLALLLASPSSRSRRSGTCAYDATHTPRRTNRHSHPTPHTTAHDYDDGQLHDYGFRYYDPVTGRWPSRDPIGENWDTGEFNEYAYIKNQVIIYFDLLGLAQHGRNKVTTTGGGDTNADQKAANERHHRGSGDQKKPKKPRTPEPPRPGKVPPAEIAEDFVRNNPGTTGQGGPGTSGGQDHAPPKKGKCKPPKVSAGSILGKTVKVVGIGGIILTPHTAEAANQGSEEWTYKSTEFGFIESHTKCCCYWTAWNRTTYVKEVPGIPYKDPDQKWWELGMTTINPYVITGAWDEYTPVPSEDFSYEKKTPDEKCFAPLRILE